MKARFGKPWKHVDLSLAASGVFSPDFGAVVLVFLPEDPDVVDEPFSCTTFII